METFISIDWDFFPVVNEWSTYEVDDGEGNKRELPGYALFDWGHAEKGIYLMPWLWGVRAGQWRRWGYDIEQVVSIDPERGATPLDVFVRELTERFDLPEGYAAESHVQAYPALMATFESLGLRRGSGMEVINFDAHHDLGYGKHSATREDVDCGDWLLAALRMGYTEYATIVYPDWKGDREWEPGVEWREEYADRISIYTWSEWLEVAYERKAAAGLFACRSGAWTPPWLDGQFEELLEMLPFAHTLPTGDPEQDRIDREWGPEMYVEPPSREDFDRALAAQGGDDG